MKLRLVIDPMKMAAESSVAVLDGDENMIDQSQTQRIGSSNGTHLNGGIQSDDNSMTLYNSILTYCRGDDGKDDTVEGIRSYVTSTTNGIGDLLDALSVIDIEISCSGDGKQSRSNFFALLSSMVPSIISEDAMKERLEADLLEAAGIIPQQKVFNQKVVRTKTKLFFKQQKFNLLREENEGYAKLISELGNEFTGGEAQAKVVLENIKALIGYFKLDPNRVLDLILESFECHLTARSFFMPLLTLYLSTCDVSGLCQIVGFKYQSYNNSNDLTTPSTLFLLTAELLKENLMTLSDIYPYLLPADKNLLQETEKAMERAKEEAKKLNTVILSDAVAEEEKAKEEQRPYEPIINDNQKVGLCNALLEVAAWEQAKEMMETLPRFSLTGHRKIAKAVSEIIHFAIQPIYKRFSPRGSLGMQIKQFETSILTCQNYSDLEGGVVGLLCHLGPHLSYDPLLLVKMIRICRGFLKEYYQSTEAYRSKAQTTWSAVVTFIDEAFLPSLSLMECNCGVADELWGLIKHLPYDIRYRLYGQWKHQSYQSHPRLIMAKAMTIKKAKYITKRLTVENVKPSGRQIGKISHNNPGILFEFLLNQIQRYDNFIGPMVDALKYLTPLAYDMLAFCIIEALANPSRVRLKQADTNISDWLQSLAQFCGAVFKKYSIEITGLLQYVANQLKSGKSLDLLVLREVIQKMSGIELTEEVTESQLQALAGGELLKAEGGYFGQVRNTKKSSQRLREALMDGRLTLPLCLLMAQQRNGIVFVEDNKRHLKLVGKLYDQCQDTLVQFGGFLATQLSADDYRSGMPSLDDLHNVYHITPDVAFFLSRSANQYEILSAVNAFKDTVRLDKIKKPQQKQEAIETYFIEMCDTVFRPVVECAVPLLPSKVWNNIGPQLYVTFWSLSMYDLYVPRERYDAEIKKLEAAIDGIDENKELTTATKKKKERERCEMIIKKLKEEQDQQIAHKKCVRKWMESKKDVWFPSKSAKGETITQFLQLCIFPRCVFTASDALYCAKFIHVIHVLQIANFSTLVCFDRIFSDISYIVASLTENEASRYGRFLCAMLQIIMHWHGDKILYDKECGRCPGFLTILRAPNNDKADYLDFENFRHVCHKWQYKLTKAVVLCLESKDYTQIRNTIIVLTKVLPHYPKVHNLGQALEKRIEKICEEEKGKRQDIFTLAMGYAGMLKMKKSSMVPEQLFHLKDKEKSTPVQTSVSGSKSTKDASQTNSTSERSDKVKKEETSRHTSSNDSSMVSLNATTSSRRGIDSPRKQTTDDKNSSEAANDSRKKSSKSPSRSLEANDSKSKKQETINIKDEDVSPHRSRSKEKEKSKIKEEKHNNRKSKKESASPPYEEPKKKKTETRSAGSTPQTISVKDEGLPVTNRNDESVRKSKEKDYNDKKSDRKRSSLDAGDGKEAKRRRDESLENDPVLKKSDGSRKEKDKTKTKSKQDNDKEIKFNRKDSAKSPPEYRVSSKEDDRTKKQYLSQTKKISR